MPVYEYKCKNNGHIFEVEQKMSDPPLTACQVCDGEVERLLGIPTTFAKGSEKTSLHKDFRTDTNKWKAVCESAFGATPKELEKIK
jgi:putative FmdB family regulatory protein